MSDPIAIAGVVVVFAMSGWMMRMMLGYQERIKELSLAKPGSASSDERLARVEQAVEAIAIEIERVSEGQRYVTKLLDERAQALIGDAPVAVPQRRIETPQQGKLL
jgi:hypothetical protein